MDMIHEIVKDFPVVLSSIITLITLLITYSKSYQAKGVISKKSLEIVEIKRIPLDEPAWSGQKHRYFLDAFTFFTLAIGNSVLSGYSYSHNFFLSLLSLLYTIMYILYAYIFFYTYKAIGNNPNSGK